MSISGIYNIGNIQRSAGASYYQPQSTRDVKFRPYDKCQPNREISTEDMEAALAISNGDLDAALKTQRPKQTENLNSYNKETENFKDRGEAWKGFTVPKYNGTGQLNPFNEHNLLLA